MPSIKDRITALFRRSQPEITTTADATPQPRRAVSNLASLFAAKREREEIIGTCRQMYDEDPRAKAIIQTLARDAVKGGFQFESDDAQAVEIIDALTTRLNLNDRLDDWARLAFRDGDTLLELGVTDDLDISAVTRKPTLRIHRFSNRFDRFDDPAFAFWMSTQDWQVKPGPSSIWFAEWQIIHARWDHDEGNRYGRPLLSASRTAWKRVKEGELDIAVRRKTRAGMRYIHTVPGDEPDIEAYMERNKPVLDNPLIALADLYGNENTSVEVLQGDARLGEIEDVEHHIDTFFLSSPIQRALLGYGKNIDFSVIGHQKQQYVETLVEIQAWVGGEFLRPLFDRQLLLKGILPERAAYELKWSPKREITADELDKVSKAALQFRALGVPDEIIATIIARFIPGIDPEMLFPEGTAVVSAERLANISAKLLAGMGRDGG